MLGNNSGRIRPSYKQGWATYGASAAPDLWKRISGAWAPFLGPTGNILREHSNNKNHGIINNASWVADGLKFEISDSAFAEMPDNVLFDGGNKFTWSWKFKLTTLGLDRAFLTKWLHGTQASWAFQTGQNASDEIAAFIAPSLGNLGSVRGNTTDANLSAGTEYRTTIVFDGEGAGNPDRLKIYLNSISDIAPRLLTISFTGTIPPSLLNSTSVMQIAKFNNLDRYNDVVFKDLFLLKGFALSAEQVAEFVFKADVMFERPSPTRYFFIPAVANLSRYHDLNGLGGQGQMTRNPLG